MSIALQFAYFILHFCSLFVTLKICNAVVVNLILILEYLQFLHNTEVDDNKSLAFPLEISIDCSLVIVFQIGNASPVIFWTPVPNGQGPISLVL